MHLQRKITREDELSAAIFELEGNVSIYAFSAVFVVELRRFTRALREVEHQYTCNNTLGLP
jgi:hypothetical protein